MVKRAAEFMDGVAKAAPPTPYEQYQALAVPEQQRIVSNLRKVAIHFDNGGSPDIRPEDVGLTDGEMNELTRYGLVSHD